MYLTAVSKRAENDAYISRLEERSRCRIGSFPNQCLHKAQRPSIDPGERAKRIRTWILQLLLATMHSKSSSISGKLRRRPQVSLTLLVVMTTAEKLQLRTVLTVSKKVKQREKNILGLEGVQ